MSKRRPHGKQVGDIIVYQGDPTQMRKIRCPHCQGEALVQKDNKGQSVCVCTTCNRKFRSVKM